MVASPTLKRCCAAFRLARASAIADRSAPRSAAVAMYVKYAASACNTVFWSVALCERLAANNVCRALSIDPDRPPKSASR